MVYAYGNSIRGRRGGVVVEAHPGEAVLTRQAVAGLGGESAVRAINSGVSAGSQITFVSFTREDTDRFIREVILPRLGELKGYNYRTADGYRVG